MYICVYIYIGTILEMVRQIVLTLTIQEGKRVRVCIQQSMGLGIFTGILNMFLYLFIYIYTFIYAYIFLSILAYIHIYMYVYMYVYLYTTINGIRHIYRCLF
jgi:hypothetical protein